MFKTMESRYLDPKNDLAFKKVFGSEAHKKIPMSFLNAVFNLQGGDKIIDLTFINSHQSPEIAARKESIVDVLVQDQKGTKYIIEMQVAKIEGFEERAQFYAAKTYCSHFKKGGQYSDLKKVVFLAITDYVVFPNKQGYKSDHVTLDKKTHEHDLKKFWFTFVELPKFNKTIDQLETIEDRWYYFLKHVDESNEILQSLGGNAEIKEAYEVLDRFHWSENELQWYEKYMMNISDEKGILAAAKKESREEGMKEGETIRAKAIARNLLSLNLPLEQIIESTGLSEEEIKNL